MPKAQKTEAVKELKESFERSDAAILAEFTGLKVLEMKELRQALAATGTQFKVVKNTLTRIAAREAAMEDLIPLLEGSTAIAFIQGDPVAAAKGLDEIAKKYPALVIKGGILEGRVLGAEQAQGLAKLKSREVLLAQLAGMFISPVQKLASLLAAPINQLGYVLAAYQEKLGAEAPAPETPAPETPAAETPAAETPGAEPEVAASTEEQNVEATAVTQETQQETTDNKTDPDKEGE
ncbi:MAG: 50S ribosomal protein L10 [Actinomycetota bacterium]|nr:50S ribosomal protein L10 [Actinomycetota bacterium]